MFTALACSFQFRNMVPLAVVAPALNPNTQAEAGGWLSEFEASLVYRMNSRTSKAIQRIPVLKKDAWAVGLNKIC